MTSLPFSFHSCRQGDTSGPLQEVERGWPEHHCSMSIGHVAPLQAGFEAKAGAVLASTRYAGTAIASPPMTRFINVRRVLGEPKRLCGTFWSGSRLE
jgi:hypothetical protein